MKEKSPLWLLCSGGLCTSRSLPVHVDMKATSSGVGADASREVARADCTRGQLYPLLALVGMASEVAYSSFSKTLSVWSDTVASLVTACVLGLIWLGTVVMYFSHSCVGPSFVVVMALAEWSREQLYPLFALVGMASEVEYSSLSNMLSVAIAPLSTANCLMAGELGLIWLGTVVMYFSRSGVGPPFVVAMALAEWSREQLYPLFALVGMASEVEYSSLSNMLSVAIAPLSTANCLMFVLMVGELGLIWLGTVVMHFSRSGVGPPLVVATALAEWSREQLYPLFALVGMASEVEYSSLSNMLSVAIAPLSTANCLMFVLMASVLGVGSVVTFLSSSVVGPLVME